MFTTTEAIVLHTTRHNDKTRIVHLYTREAGRLSVIVYGNSKKSIVFSPLSLVETTYSTKPSAMPILKEIELITRKDTLNEGLKIRDIGRQSVATFIAEIIYRSERHPLKDTELFDFFVATINELDSENFENCHLRFLIGYAQHIGIALDIYSDGATLNLQTAESMYDAPRHEDYLNSKELDLLRQLNEGTTIRINRKDKQALLEKLCRFYQLQIDGFTLPKSLAVLEQVFD